MIVMSKDEATGIRRIMFYYVGTEMFISILIITADKMCAFDDEQPKLN